MKFKLGLFILLFCALPYKLISQEVENSMFGIQSGFLGIWANHEWRISHHWVLRSELGLDGAQEGGVHNGNFPIFLPSISIEPRWYYNLPKRKVDGMDIFHNAANFASLNIKWYPNWFSLSGQENVKVEDGLFIIPTWGIKRNLSWRLNCELGAGVGIDFKGPGKFDGETIRPIYSVLVRVGYKIF